MNGRATVLKAISKYQTPFNAPMIESETGLSRQLVHHHLGKFVENGWLNKVGNSYEVISLEQIIDDLADNTEQRIGTKRPRERGLISKDKADEFGEVFAAIAAMRKLQTEEFVDTHHAANQIIDETILYFRELKRYLNGVSMTKRTAGKKFNDQNLIDKLWLYIQLLGFETELNYAEWENDLKDKANEAQTRTNNAA